MLACSNSAGRHYAIEWLMQLSPPYPPEVWPSLERLSQGPGKARWALEILLEHGPEPTKTLPHVIEYLEACLSAGLGHHFRGQPKGTLLVDLVGRMGPQARPAIPILWRVMVARPEYAISPTAAVALGRILPPLGPAAAQMVPDVVASLSRVLQDYADQGVCAIDPVEAIETLGAIGPAALPTRRVLTQLQERPPAAASSRGPAPRTVSQAAAEAIEAIDADPS